MKVPSQLAIRLLTRFYHGPHAESLIGDLVEEHHNGRSALWMWKQVFSAIVLTRLRSTSKALWIGGARILSHILIEFSLILAVIVVLDEWRRTHSIASWISLKGLYGLSILVAMGALGYALRRYALRTRARNLSS